MKPILGFLLIICLVGCEGPTGPAGESIQGEKGEKGDRGNTGLPGRQGEQGEPAPTSEIDYLKRRLAAAEAQLDLIFGDEEEPQPLKLGDTQLRFINGFVVEKPLYEQGRYVKGEIENYGDFDAVNVRIVSRFRNRNGAALTEGSWKIGTIRSGEVVLFYILTESIGYREEIYSMDYQLLYTEGGEAKIGGEGNISL